MKCKKVKVLVIDDSALARAILTEIIDQDVRLEVVGSAFDPHDAREKIKRLRPDVLTLDIEMPKMNGLKFLENLMRLRPMPVVMISTKTKRGAPATLKALELGAFDFLPKPEAGVVELQSYANYLVNMILAASRSQVIRYKNSNRISVPEEQLPRSALHPECIICIGASTGGPKAIKDLASMIPENCPPIVIALHMLEGYSKRYAQRLNNFLPQSVYEAYNGQRIESNSIYIAPSHAHLRIQRSITGYTCQLADEKHVQEHKPSVEVLFDSVTKAARNYALGILLTGMGKDGSEALLRMRQAGCHTIIQNEETSSVWGMAGTAYKLGAAKDVLSLDGIADSIVSHCFRSAMK